MGRSIPLAKALRTRSSPTDRTARLFARAEISAQLRSQVEGNTNVKWLHSQKLTDQPYYARDRPPNYWT